ncbi:MAG: FtsW/RodA/SpoVE family cell cycle protein [Gallibacter sp.]|nr:FtsW/RodA/SpoVE family cell cycle protein [Gallibacter sp.]
MCFAIISIVLMFSISYDNGIVISKRVIIQGFSYLLGFIAILISSNMNYSVLETYQKQLYIFSVIFLLTPYLPGIGVEQFGARSWINLGITKFQPSEIVKLTFIFVMANYFSKRKDNLNYFSDFVKAVLYAAPIILIVLKDDFGSAFVFGIIFISMILYAGLRLKIFTRIMIGFAVLLPFMFSFLDAYQKQRITGFLYPNDLSIQATYQVYQSKLAIGSGGIFGKGLFSGTQTQLDFLPVKESDFIFAVLCEELGLIAGTILIVLFIKFLLSILKLSYSTSDSYANLILIGIVGMFAAQFFENIAMCMGLLPVTGITLPFISYGGSSILSNMLAVAIVLNIAINHRGIVFVRR